MSDPQYVLYFSHSWLPEHVDLNIELWDHLWEHCLLLVDDNQEYQPPYYISRIEHLIQRSDLFLAVLVSSPAGARHASPYALFEIALAERAGLPRFVLYENRTGFEPGTLQTANGDVRYLSFDIEDMAAGRGGYAWAGLADWLATVRAQAQPRASQAIQRAAVLLPQGPERSRVMDAVGRGLAAAGFEMHDLAAAANDVEALAMLRAAALLVADIGCEALWDVYGMAHALMVPTVRLLGSGQDLDRLPSILRGHPAGYQHDLVGWSEIRELEEAVADRAGAIRRTLSEIDDREEGRAYFERRR